MDTKAIRERVLSLAIQGKLLPQDATDEPASVLLDRIRKERADLIKQKKIKAPKNESVIFRGDDGLFYERVGKSVTCIQDEIPFEIPSSWEWVRLGEIAQYKKGPFGSSITKAMFIPRSDDAVKVYEQKNAIRKNANLGSYYISKDHFQKLINFSVRPNDIIVSCAGTIGETYVLPNTIEEGIINQALMYIRAYDHSIIDFYLIYFKNVLQAASNQNSSGTAIKNIPPFAIFKQFLMPIPSIDEQKRIVSSVKNILKNIEKIENHQLAIESDFKRLKEKALDLAIRGKLLPQNPDDEPASELLERIRKEKQALIKAKKIKAPKQESFIYRKDDGSFYERIGKTEICIDDEIPFDIPNSWEWVRLESVAYLLSGRDLLPHQYNSNNNGIPYITGASNIDKGNLIINRWTKEPVTISRKGHLLLSCKGTIGNLAINTIGDAHIARQIMSIAPLMINVEYIKLFFTYYIQHLEKAAQGIIPGISRSDVLNALIPIPPTNEQMSIISMLESINAQI